jgi:hypothetical protein
MTEWRNELLKDMINAMYKVENMECSKLLVMARAALAVAEPVIREQCVNMVEKSFGIMAGEATNVKHLEWPRHPYKVMPRHIWNWYWTRTLPMHWRLMRAAAAAIREGGKDEN